VGFQRALQHPQVDESLLRRRDRHEDPVAAAEQAFVDLGVLQSALEAYIGANKFGRFVMSSAAARIDESALSTRPLKQVEADALRADVLVAVHRETEARALLDTVLKDDPNNAQPHESIATL